MNLCEAIDAFKENKDDSILGIAPPYWDDGNDENGVDAYVTPVFDDGGKLSELNLWRRGGRGLYYADANDISSDWILVKEINLNKSESESLATAAVAAR